MRLRSLLARAALLGLMPTSSWAVPLHSAESLRDDCLAYQEDSHSVQGTRCAVYVRGFVDGTLAVHGQIAPQARAESARESWIERATRTRLGRARDRTGRERFVYCVDESVPVAEVIERILEHLDANPPAADDSARDVVHAALRRYFPCACSSAGNAG